MVKIAMEVILGEKLKDLPYGTGLKEADKLIAVKAPVFSFVKLQDVDAALTPEMKSTGEVLGIDSDYSKAMMKAFLGAGYKFPERGKALVTVSENSKKEVVQHVKGLMSLGFDIIATKGTSDFLNRMNINNVCMDINDLDSLQDMMKEGKIDMMINIPTKGKDVSRAGFKLRSLAEHLDIPNFTCLDTVKVYLEAMKTYRSEEAVDYDTIDYYLD